MFYDQSRVIDLKNQYLSDSFAEHYPSPDEQLGIICTSSDTTFRLWSPLAVSVTLHLYANGDNGSLIRAVPMEKNSQGIWSAFLIGDWHCTYYSYRIDHGSYTEETGDPYAISCGCNSGRCMVVDLSRTDPQGWDLDQTPPLPNETIIYELHIKEFSWQEHGGFPAEVRGKYKAFTCEHTTLNGDGIHPTGLDYLSDLGISHVQIMPAYDYGSVDENDMSHFNWGYDPVYYNVPEGSYASDPHHGEVRIREFKEMIQALHKKGFRVIMDVVYNHTYSLESVFNQVVPWYYYRTNADGTPCNGSACGNDFASEMPMASKFILDSVLYWAREYHIDGFRFDLMGLLNVDLMNQIRSRLDEIYGPGEKMLYGEPWAAAETNMLPGFMQALKANVHKLSDHIAIFSDDIRDSIRGHVFDMDIRGFVTGSDGLEEDILRSAKAWCFPDSNVKAPSQIISYISAHDNHTLWDKLGYTFTDYESHLAANKLAATIYMTCQGYLFMLSGEEFGRTKDNHDNTYNESIELNRLDWERAYAFHELREYYKGLIAFRKQCPALCDKSPSASMRIANPHIAPGMVGFYVSNREGSWNTLCILYNRNDVPFSVPLMDGKWEVLIDQESSFHWKNPSQILEGTACIAPRSALILGRKF